MSLWLKGWAINHEQDGTLQYKWSTRASDKLKQLALDVLTKAPILPEAHAELEPSCNKHVCIEDNKENHVRQPIFQIAGGPHITKVTKKISEWKQAHV